MRRVIRSIAAVLLLAPAAFSQPFFFGEPTPLTDTRYVAYGGGSRLVTDGTLPFLLWNPDGTARLTPVTPIRRVGRPVIDGWTTDAVWTGSHFLVVALGTDGRMVSRRVGADGEAIGEPQTILTGAPGPVRLSFDGSRVLLLFGQMPLHAQILSRDGAPVGQPEVIPIAVSIARSIAVTARSGMFVVAVSGNEGIATASNSNGVWSTGLISAAADESRRVSIAASPTTTLTMWTNAQGSIEATTTSLDRPGQISTYTLGETQNARDVAVTWDGKDFVYAYRIGTRLHFRYFNAPFPFASTNVGPDSRVELVSVNGRTHGSWQAATGTNPLIVRDVATLAGDGGAFGAAPQTLQASASSATSALFVWFEDRLLHAGVRTSSGDWFERQIATSDEHVPLAASDGTGFVIIHATGQETASDAPSWAATLLDAEGRTVAISSRVPFYPFGIAWTGTAYAVVGLDSGQRIVGSLLSPAGTVTQPAILALPRAGNSVLNPRVASRGNELLVVWEDHRPFFCFPPCYPAADILGARFTPTLQRVDAQSLLFSSDASVSPDVLWDGTRYVIAWSKIGAIEYRTLRTNSAISGITTISGVSADDSPFTPRLVQLPNGVAIAAAEGKVAFLNDGGATVLQVGVAGPQVLATAGGRLLQVQSMRRNEMPYHGAPRLQIRVGDLVTPAPKPSAPQITRATLSVAAGVMIIEWDAPPEAVNGYRVEYRVDDGAWNELDEWFDSRTTELAIRPWRSDPVRYQFRVRALNDAGAGAYSSPATVRSAKRRAVG